MAYNGNTSSSSGDPTTNKVQNGDSGNDSLITNRFSFSQDSVSGGDDIVSGTSSGGGGGGGGGVGGVGEGSLGTSPSTEIEGDVNSIFLCEFHPTAGPKIMLQVPNDHVTKDLFRIVHQYIIPKVPLQGSFLSISMFGKKILGYPIRLLNESYARNAFYFNLCFVFRPTTRTICYEPVVKKLTEHFISLERSDKILSQIKMPDKCERIRTILTRVRDDLNRDKVCMLQEGSTTVPLCVVTNYQDITIGAHQAPVLLEKFYRYKRDQWDLTTQRIIQYITGFHHVDRIAELALMALELVKECIKHLVILDVAVLVPVFQYNNMYRPTPKLSQLAKCPKMQARCIAKCSLKSQQRKCNVTDIFRMFAAMAHGASFGEICVRFNPASLHINDRQMVLFGLVEGLIRIVNKYPISVKRNLFVNTNCFAPNDEDDEDIPGKGTPNIFSSSFGQDEIYPYPLISSSSSNNNNNNEKTEFAIPRSGQELTKQRNLVQIWKRYYNYCDKSLKEKSGGGGCPPDSNPAILYTGNKSFDELGCAIGFSNHQLDDLLSRDKHCIVLFK